MSALAEERRATRSGNAGRSQSRPVTARRPYIDMNGATMVSIAAIALTVIGLLYLIQTSQVAQLGYDMSRLQSREDALALEISELQYEVARYESLHTVEEMAEQRLGMVPMTNYEFIDVQEPAQRELSLPEPRAAKQDSIVERVINTLAGTGYAEDPSHSDPVLQTGEVSP